MTPTYTHSLRFISIMIAIIVAGISFATVAYASANTLTPNPSGYGTGPVSGYVVTNIKYHFASDPTMINAVSFTLSDKSTNVKIGLSSVQSVWFACMNVGSNDWTCDTANTSVRSVDELKVMASSN